MKSIRGRVIILICWLVGFYSMEPLLEPMDISGLTYLFILGMIIIALTVPHLVRLPLWVFLLVPIPVFYGIRLSLGLPMMNTSILLAIAETCAIMLTTFLAYQVGLAICDFENAVSHITIGHGDRVLENISNGAGSLYREVRRARNHKRPLALMAVSIEEKSLQLNLDRVVLEAQQAMMKQYALTSVSRQLCENLEDCDLIVQNNGHFLILVPETLPEHLPGLIERLRRQVSEQTGVELKIGAASLPQDGYTLESLVEQATKGMEMDLASEFNIKLKQMSVKQHVS